MPSCTKMTPSATLTASAPGTRTISGLELHGLHTPCVRFTTWVAPPPRNTRFRLSADLAGRDRIPAGFQREISEMVAPPPNLPGLAWHTQVVRYASKSHFRSDSALTDFWNNHKASEILQLHNRKCKLYVNDTDFPSFRYRLERQGGTHFFPRI